MSEFRPSRYLLVPVDAVSLIPKAREKAQPYFGGSRTLWVPVPVVLADLSRYSTAKTDPERYREAHALLQHVGVEGVKLLLHSGALATALNAAVAAPQGNE